MKIANRQPKERNSYIKATLVNNRFKVKMEAVYNNMNITLNDAIIDTGCTHSHITCDEIYMFDDSDEDKIKRLDIKRQAIMDYSCTLGYGVESDKRVRLDIRKMSLEDKVNCERLKIFEPFRQIRVNGIPVGNRSLGVSYDYNGTSLLGMEILKDWCIYIGESLHTKTDTLIACYKSDISDEFIQALIDEFDIGKLVISKALKQMNLNAIIANAVNKKI